MRTDYVYYEVHRSRNKGEFWSNLTHGLELSWDEANCFMEKEIEKHPSDWLKLIKVQSTTIRDYTGNKKKKSVKKSDSKEPRIHGYTIPEYIRLDELEGEKNEHPKSSPDSSIINMEYVDIDHILKVGRDFQNTDTWRGAHYDTVKMLCDTIEYLRDKCEKEKTK